MAKRNPTPDTTVAQVRFTGRTPGLVKNLSGFKKSHHTLPDAITPATTAFLAKLCAADLAAEAETCFQNIRAAFAYKRAELSLDLATPAATLTAKDFVLELHCTFDAPDPASYLLTRTLHSVRAPDLLHTPACETAFAGKFSELGFVLTKGARVETLIDAIESLDTRTALRVDYPSDCRDCTLAVEGVPATVRFDGTELTLRFPQNASPRELIAAFAVVRHAFTLTGHPALSTFLA